MLILRLPVVLFSAIANSLGRRSDRRTWRRLLQAIWAVVALTTTHAVILATGDPEMQYFVATVLNLSAVIAFVLVVVGVVTWATIHALEALLFPVIQRHFGWMIAWNFLRSHREKDTQPKAYAGGETPARRAMWCWAGLSAVLLVGSFFIPVHLRGPGARAALCPIQVGLGLTAALAMSWGARRTVASGTVDWLDRWHARARTTGSSRPVTTTTFISIVGVGVGVWALTVVLSVMGGFENDLRSKILATTPHVIIQDEEPMEGLPLTDDTLAQLQALPNVTATIPHVHGDVILSSFENRNVSLVLKGLRHPDIVASDHHLTRDMREGTLDKLRSDDGLTLKVRSLFYDPPNDTDDTGDIEPDPIETVVVEKTSPTSQTFPPLFIGSELANSLLVGLGSTVTVLSPREGVGFLGNQPRVKTYRIAGIFHSGMYEFDLKLAYTRLEDAQRFFHMGDAVNRVELRLGDVHQSDVVVAQATPLLNAPTVEILDWKALNKNLFSALALEKIVMFIVLAFIVLVASFNIVGSLIMIIIEKSKEIAIMKAMGAGPRGIWQVFLLLGSVVGLIGSLSGLIVGLSTCAIIRFFGIPLPRQYYIEFLPVHVDWVTTGLVFFAGIALCMMATLYPAKEAARLQLVEGLRYE